MGRNLLRAQVDQLDAGILGKLKCLNVNLPSLVVIMALQKSPVVSHILSNVCVLEDSVKMLEKYLVW